MLDRTCHRDGCNLVSWSGFADVDMTWFGDDFGTLSQHRMCPRRYRRYFCCRLLWPFGLCECVCRRVFKFLSASRWHAQHLSLRAVTVLASRGSCWFPPRTWWVLAVPLDVRCDPLSRIPLGQVAVPDYSRLCLPCWLRCEALLQSGVRTCTFRGDRLLLPSFRQTGGATRGRSVW